MNSYQDKYLKYKNKYLQLKNQIGGEEFNSTADVERKYPNLTKNWTRQLSNGSGQYDVCYHKNDGTNLHCCKVRDQDRWHCSNNPPASPKKQEQNRMVNQANENAQKWQQFQKSQQK
jgi:hypothetical protein